MFGKVISRYTGLNKSPTPKQLLIYLPLIMFHNYPQTASFRWSADGKQVTCSNCKCKVTHRGLAVHFKNSAACQSKYTEEHEELLRKKK